MLYPAPKLDLYGANLFPYPDLEFTPPLETPYPLLEGIPGNPFIPPIAILLGTEGNFNSFPPLDPRFAC